MRIFGTIILLDRSRTQVLTDGTEPIFMFLRSTGLYIQAHKQQWCVTYDALQGT